jgi:DNA primase
MTIIDDIKARIKLEDIVAQTASVKLRRSGANLTGFCPFHNNRNTPSFVVFAGTQTWRCFGTCNEGGDVFDFVMKQNPGWDIKEAISHLAGVAGIALTSDGADLSQRLAARAKEDALKIAMRVFRRWLVGETDRDGSVKREPDQAALSYALDRGWTLETIKLEGVGFSGRATAEAFKEMRGEFQMHGIDLESPEAVMVLGYRGDVAAWARAHDLDAALFGDKFIQGMMSKPGLVYAHKFNGVIQYLSARLLPGFDGERKSHNPSSALAGPRQPYFNSLHRGHHAEGKPKGTRIHIVEGQGDAITWRQFGEPAMALCGSSWRHLIDSGVVEMLKEEYEDICYTTDADAPGQAVLTGKNNDFPLSTAFGPMLWVERTPQIVWKRPSGDEKAIKDVNDIAQWCNDEKIDDEKRGQVIRQVIQKAKPIVVLAADYTGSLAGNVKEKAIRELLRPLVVAMPNQPRLNYSAEIAEVLYPNLGKTERTSLFSKWLTAEVKAAAEEDDDDELTKEQTLGGWYPDDETENSGYLVEIFYDRKLKRIRFAYAHITDMAAGQRETGVANFLIIGNRKLEPPDQDELIETGAVKVASGLGPLKSSSELINRMAHYYEKYFYLEEKSRYKFCGSWALNTWVYDCFDALNFLRARGGPGSGKSDLMYLVGLTSYRFAVTLSTSSSASYRGLAKIYKATTMIDEADNLMKKDDGTMEAFLKGRAMKRYSNSLNMMETMSNGMKIFVPSVTPVYGPTLITMYKSFQDGGIENRCMTFDLSQVDTITLDKAGMEPGYYPPELEDDADEIRNMCLRWRLETWRPKIELTPEQRKQYRLVDPLVSPRVNQVLYPMKVLAVLQNDGDLLESLKMIGRANYEDEMIKRAGSFEAVILRAVLAADIAKDIELGLPAQASKSYAEKVKGYADKVKMGKLSKRPTARYILYKDVAQIANEIFDVENFADGVEDKKKNAVKSKTIGDICRESFRLPVERTSEGWVVILDKERLDIAKLRLGLDREAEYLPGGDEAAAMTTKPSTPVKPVQADFEHWDTPDDGPLPGVWDEESGDWKDL